MKLFSVTGRRLAGIGVLIAVVCALPALVKPHQLDLLIFLFVNIIVAVAYRLIVIVGEWSFCHIILMGVGAYGAALLTTSFAVTPWFGMVSGPLAATGVAYILSFPLFRMKGFYFIVGSFVAGEAIRLCWSKYRAVFGGPSGLVNIPTLEFAGIDLGSPVPFYFFAFAIALISLTAMYRIEHSRLGLTLGSIASSEALAQSVGVNAKHYRVLIFIIAAFFTGVAGALHAHYLTAVGPDSFGFAPMLAVTVWVMVGGTGAFSGPILGTIVLTGVDELLRGFEQYRAGVYGLLLILTMTFLPRGLQSVVSLSWSPLWRWGTGAARRPADGSRSKRRCL